MNTGGSILIVTVGVIWKVLISNHFKSQKIIIVIVFTVKYSSCVFG